MHPMTNMALRAGRKAGQIIVRAMDRIEILTVEEKRRHDLVSEVDRNAEDAIIEVLHRAYPDHGIIGEESGIVFPEAEYTWIIDPLDGTTNFLQGIPHFAVSIAVRHHTQIEHGVIIDPVRNEEFVASRGQGAQLNASASAFPLAFASRTRCWPRD
jgi:myo-inositol-1(or 4)-monophosphatase